METQAVVTISPLGLTELLLWGGLGGVCVELLKHVRKLHGKQVPDAFEITVSLILIALSGFVAAVYQGQVQSMLIAVQIGATAPAIIGAWASGGPPPPGGGSGPRAGGGGGGTAVLEQADVASRVHQALRWTDPDV